MLKRGEIYFASPTELNDTHECKPKIVFNGSQELWLRLIDYILVNICISLNISPEAETAKKIIPLKNKIYASIKKNKTCNMDFIKTKEVLKAAIGESINNILSELESKHIINTFSYIFDNKVQSNLTERKYISSFSITATNPTMWGHYGAAEKGFIIVYESHNKIINASSELNILNGYRFKESKTIELGLYDECGLELKKVVYAKVPAKINGFRRLINKFRYTEEESHYDVPESLYEDADALEENSIGLIKYSDWKYENEYRLIFPAFTDLASPLRTLQVNSHHIKGIIFGSRTSLEDKEKITAACKYLILSKNKNDDLLFFEITTDTNKYKLNITPVGLLNKENCHIILPTKKIKELPKEKIEQLEMMAKNITTNDIKNT